ncbi:FAD-binding oxidoreductase [Streptomyces sp. 8K308]|uniref:FAD-binding oxidoreductase n=1 Tax=Streptomyces sp. 8K308 TaxID=2530388 RepID=UPI001052BDF4|nr:FAD-binding oxidoreductase [Streptomyces sp. 8K308]TDC20151.1 FAD-binding oxidoreductase [Streptomyces sp. 8K308]
MTTGTSRRGFLAGAATGGALATGLLPELAHAQAPRSAAASTGIGPSDVLPSDRRYRDLVRGWNGRFVGDPDYVTVAGSTEQVAEALARAVAQGKRLAVRSGGHCLENFVSNPDVRVVLDVSQLRSIRWDQRHRAVVVEPGCSLRDVYKTLHTAWGVTVPGGACPSVGAGGHIAGGGYGPLSRRYGVVPDHLYAVEVVTVDRSGTPRTVLATREPRDPNRELWWAHTGGGGGNFGVVTKYYLRSADARGNDPTTLLPRAPEQSRTVRYVFPWAALNEQGFSRLLRGYISWHAEHSAPGSPYTRLFADLWGLHVNTAPGVTLNVTVDPSESDHESLLAGFRSDVVDQVGVTPVVSETVLPWLQSVWAAGYADTGAVVGRRNKSKGTYLRASYTDAQLSTTYRYLTATDLRAPMAGVLLGGFGGRANVPGPDDTAVPQRDSVLKVLHTVHWDNPSQDERHLSWVRNFYRDVHAATGGVPEVDGEVEDGSYINYADVDVADPAWNESGVAWQRFYYKDSYERLRQVKGRWDPRNVFRHALSVELPS